MYSLDRKTRYITIDMIKGDMEYQDLCDDATPFPNSSNTPPPSSHPATLLQLSDMSVFVVKVMSESVCTCKLTSVSV